jgi:tRNA-dihydrouridine synthase
MITLLAPPSPFVSPPHIRGCGAILLNKPKKLVEIVGAMTKALHSRQVTVKIRTGWDGE